MDWEEVKPIFERNPLSRLNFCQELWEAFWNTAIPGTTYERDEENDEIRVTERPSIPNTAEAKRIKDIAKMLGCEWARASYVRPRLRKTVRTYSLRDGKK